MLKQHNEAYPTLFRDTDTDRVINFADYHPWETSELLTRNYHTFTTGVETVLRGWRFSCNTWPTSENAALLVTLSMRSEPNKKKILAQSTLGSLLSVAGKQLTDLERVAGGFEQIYLPVGTDFFITFEEPRATSNRDPGLRLHLRGLQR